MEKNVGQMPPLVFTAGETAELLKVTEKTVYRVVQRQRLHSIKSLRHLRITRASLEKFMTEDGGGK